MSKQPANKSAFVIHAFKQQPPKDPDLPRRSWDKLEDAIQQIFNENAGDLSFEELYRTGYNMVLHKHGDVLYNNVETVLKERSSLLCEKVAVHTDETFLAAVKKVWLDHKRSLLMVRDILMYMDRTFVKQNQKKPVYEMGLAIFCQNCTRAARVKVRLRDLLLDLIKKERDGEKIDRDLVRSVTQMMLDMGKTVFTEDFERPFLESSQLYYTMWTETRIATFSTPEYLKNVDTRIQEEAERVKACLGLEYNAGDGGIKNVVETQMIQRQMQALVDKEGSGLVRLLEESRVEDLRRMFDLFTRVPDGQRIILEKMSEHVLQKGKDIVQSSEVQGEPLQYVQNLIELKDQYDKLIADAFRGEKAFTNALYKAFETFINLNSRSPEYISLAMDSHLKGSKSKSGALVAASEEQAEMQLERALQMFRFLQEKDMFEKYYKQHLSKRLLGDRSQSEDMERKVIQMLKNECGYQFTAKLEGMFKDMNTSSDLNERFQQHMHQMRVADGVASSISVDLQVKVLTTGFWPTQPSVQCELPPEIAKACGIFKRFYLEQHTGRQLTWQTTMGNADLKARYDKHYQINVPTLSMVVLLLFTDSSSGVMSYKDIERSTTMQPNDLKRTLQGLACDKFKLLVKDPKGKEVGEDDNFSFNASFSNRMIKFKLSSIAPLKETNEEVQASRNKMNEDRNPQIDAAIVRVMKARRQMNHNQLLIEVTKQLQSRFQPNPVVIKKRIEGLIDRDFLQRQRGDMQTYEYLA